MGVLFFIISCSKDESVTQATQVPAYLATLFCWENAELTDIHTIQADHHEHAESPCIWTVFYSKCTEVFSSALTLRAASSALKKKGKQLNTSFQNKSTIFFCL